MPGTWNYLLHSNWNNFQIKSAFICQCPCFILTLLLPHTFSSDNYNSLVRWGRNRNPKPTRPILNIFPIMLEGLKALGVGCFNRPRTSIDRVCAMLSRRFVLLSLHGYCCMSLGNLLLLPMHDGCCMKQGGQQNDGAGDWQHLERACTVAIFWCLQCENNFVDILPMLWLGQMKYTWPGSNGRPSAC